MAQLQYIGARYVPVWYVNSVDQTANWEVNVEYEPLTFVTTPNNHLYLSKKTVPDNIGTPAQNTDYWLDMGVYGGNYSQLQQEIDDMKDGTIVGSLQYQITENATDIDILKNKKRYYIFQGDSYSLTSTYSFSTWPQILASYMSLTADDYTLLSNDGAGFVDTGTYGTFEQQLENNPISENVTDILVAAGANDNSYTEVNIYNAVTSYISKAKTLYPDARIHIAMVGWSRQKTMAVNIWQKVYGAYKDAALAHNCDFIEESSYSLIMGSDFFDNSVHPNELGQLKIGKTLCSALNGYPTKCAYVYTPTVSAISGYTIAANQISIKQFGDHINFRWWSESSNYIRITKSPSGTFTRNWMEIATLDIGVYIGNYLNFSVAANIILNDSTVSCMPISIRIVENHLYLSANFDQPNVAYIQLPNICVDFPVRNLT